MPEYVGSPRDLSAIYEGRRERWDPWHAAQDIVEQAIFGNLPTKYNDLFADNDIRLEIRTIRTADDDLTALTSKVFPILVNPLGKRSDSKTALDNAERVEKIAYGWYDGAAQRGGLEIDGIMHQLARHQVRFADGVLRVLPDYNRKLMFFEALDPRCHFPPSGWTPWSQTRLNDTLIVTEMTLGEVKARYAREDPTIMMRLNNAYSKMTSTPSGEWVQDDRQKIKVGQFYCRDYWYVAALGHEDSITLLETSYGDPGFPGVCPVTSFMQFESEPLFMGQIGIEAALQKVLNQEIRATDKMIDGPIVGPKLLGDKWNPVGYNIVDTQSGEKVFMPQRMGPSSPLNTERVLGSLVGLARILNRNPESFQGGGDASSAKAVQTLQAGVRSTVEDILWAPFMNAFPRVFDNCLEMEQNLWPNERKTAQGTRSKQTFEVDYIPSVHLEGYLGRIKIEPGMGLGGYQAKLDLMQHEQGGYISKQTLREMHPDIKNVQEETRRIEREQVEAFANAAFEALAASDPLTALKADFELMKQIQSGKSKFEAIQEVINKGLLEPPQQEMPGMPQLPPGLPGSPELPGPPPSLPAARGF